MALAWSHNSWYHPFVARQVRAGRRPGERPGRLLDLGCGSGRLSSYLAADADIVHAIDSDADIVRVARATASANVEAVVADALTWLADRPARYDAIVSMSVLHHLDTDEALRLAAATLTPGGRFVAVTHVRPELPRDVLAELRATALHHAVGLGLAISARLRGREPRLRQHLAEDVAQGMQIAEPKLTADELRTITARRMPGATVRRLVLWRHAIVWTRPGEG